MSKFKKSSAVNNYFANELQNRNLVALPNRVWVMDLCSLKGSLRAKAGCFKKMETRNVKVLLVLDLGTREAILGKAFSVLNNGNVRSKYVVRELMNLLKRRGIEQSGGEQLLLHSDRGSEFTSNDYKKLFKLYPQCIGSMSASAKPTDNAVAERFVRTFKNQLVEGGKWPEHFMSVSEAQSLVTKRLKFYNEEHLPRNFKNKSPSEMHLALTNIKEDAPNTIAHWANKKTEPPLDAISLDISRFKERAVLRWDSSKKEGWDAEKSLKRTELFSSIAAFGALRHDESFSQLSAELGLINENISDLKDALEAMTKKKKRSVRRELPLRAGADGSVYKFLMSMSRPKGANRFIWSRNRVAITLLYLLGARASDIASLTLKDLSQGVKLGYFQLQQPKTGKQRLVVLPEQAKDYLAVIEKDLQVVFNGEAMNHLGNSHVKGLQLEGNHWLRSLNKFMLPARQHFGLSLSSHSFRVNYITKLLRKVPLQNAKTIIGHRDIRTTERYNRYEVTSVETLGLVTSIFEADG